MFGIGLLELIIILSNLSYTGFSVDDCVAVTETVEVIEHEMRSEKPRKSFLRTALSTLKGIKGTMEFAAAAVALIEFVQTFVGP